MRYSWTDEYVLNLPYARTLQLTEVILAKKSQAEKQKDIRAAMIAYLVNPPQEDMNFDQYLHHLGIGEKKVDESTFSDPTTREEAESIAANIKKLFEGEVK